VTQSQLTRKGIIDTNALQSPQLRAYLSKSASNFAVLTDYAAMESYKGDTLVNIFRNMEVIADFPKQVIILKPTGVICGLRGRRAGLQRRMIDDSQTRDFQSYCDALHAAKGGNESARKQLLAYGHDADAHLNRMLADAMTMPEIIDDITEIFSDDELKIIRNGKPFTDSLIAKFLENVAMMTRSLYQQHPNATVVADTDELTNAILFRFALCSFVWALDWIAVGDPKGVKAERIRNDIVDVNFATFATYFDSLMSMDNKTIRIYMRSLFVLEAISGGKLVDGATVSPNAA
jgi:hypothetical protein